MNQVVKNDLDIRYPLIVDQYRISAVNNTLSAPNLDSITVLAICNFVFQNYQTTVRIQTDL